MDNQNQEDGLTKEEIKKSALNRLSLSEIDSQYSTKAKSNNQSVVNEKFIPLIAGLGTFIVFLIITLGGYFSYSLFFKGDASNKSIELESIEVNESITADGQSDICSVNSNVPQKACQAIASLSTDTSVENLYLSANAVSQVSNIPFGKSISVNEESWDQVDGATAYVIITTNTPQEDTIELQLKLQKIGKQWLITEVEVL